MNMREWAKREVEIACKREKAMKSKSISDYGCMCYESALKAFECLLEDRHSGGSMQFTKGILMRLIDGKPLTPIEDTEDVWCERYKKEDCTVYQCTRMSSLFKNVYDNGAVTYSDVDSHVYHCVDTSSYWGSSLVAGIYEEMFPIKMPYYPDVKKYVYEGMDILTDDENGDYDTVAIYYVTTPTGDKVDINRYFADKRLYPNSPTVYGDWIEIDKDTWHKHVNMDSNRIMEG